MNIRLTKHIFGDLKVNPDRLIGIYGPRSISQRELSDMEIAERISNPIGTPPIRDIAKGARNVLIVTDDNTRATPLHRLLPPLLAELKMVGVPEESITFLIALGTHRPMTEEEIRTKFGDTIVGRYLIVNHAWNDPRSLISLGVCDLGFEVVINRLVKSADLILTVGSIVPHATMGYSGGGKTIIPGICGEKTIENTHWAALDYAMADILGNFDNRVRELAVSVCRKVGLNAIINTILFDSDRVLDLVVGDVEEAHRKGTEICQEIYNVKIPQKAEIVIAEAYPTDIDLRQAIKAICAADLVCKDEGVIILPADCPEGVSPQFQEFVQYGFSQPEKLYQLVEAGELKQKLMAYTLVAIGRIISKRVRAILVSPNIGAEEANQMGFLWAPELQTAYEQALKIVGPSANTVVLKQAGIILPKVEMSNVGDSGGSVCAR